MRLSFVSSPPARLVCPKGHARGCDRRSAKVCPQATHARCSLVRPRLVFITPNGICGEARLGAELAVEALAGGASLVQLRDREASPGALRRAAECIAEALPSPRSLVVNGPCSIPIAGQLGHGVGVHLREGDVEDLLPGALLGRELSPGAVVGCSVHSLPAAEKALFPILGRCPTYLQVGTMFPTGSHPGKVPEGPGLVRDMRMRFGNKVTLIAVGGIVESNIGCVVGPGMADGAAVISSIAQAASPRLASQRLFNAASTHWKDAANS